MLLQTKQSEIDSKVASLSTAIEKLEKVLELNVVPNKEEIHSKIKAMKTELSILTKRKNTLKLNREEKKTKWVKQNENELKRTHWRNPIAY